MSFVAMLFTVPSSTDASLVMMTIVAIPIATALTFIYNGLRAIRAVTPP